MVVKLQRSTGYFIAKGYILNPGHANNKNSLMCLYSECENVCCQTNYQNKKWSTANECLLEKRFMGGEVNM